MITRELKSKVDHLWTTFWNNGISNPLSVIEQISYLLFIKRLDDLEVTKERKARRLGRSVEQPTFAEDEQECRWSYFKNLDDSDKKLEIVRDLAFPFIKQLGGEAADSPYARHMQDAVFLISSAALLDSVVTQIDQIPMEDRDTKGDLYEYMLSKLSTAGTNGQFRTPRHIIKMMVALMAPGPNEIICDPACGTGGFLVGAAEYVRDLKDGEGNSVLNAPGNLAHFNDGMFHGFDFDATMLRIGSMNLMLHGVEQPAIEARDSLSEDHAGAEEAFTMILANPPFKGAIEKSVIAKDLLKIVKTTKTELLFLALVLRLLKTGGRAAVIVPEGVLFGSSKAHKDIRKKLVEEHKLDGVISMPSGVFKPYAGVRTAILLLTKAEVEEKKSDSVWFCDMEADGLSLDDKRQPTDENDIPNILEEWKRRDSRSNYERESKTFLVPRREIAEKGYNLLPQRYRINPDLEFLSTPPEGFEKLLLKEVADIFFSPSYANNRRHKKGISKKDKASEHHQVAIVSGKDIDQQGRIIFEHPTRCRFAKEVLRKTLLKKGDILIQRNYTNRLRVSFIATEPEVYTTFDFSLLCIRPKSLNNAEHIFTFLQSERGQRLINLTSKAYSSAVFRHLSISVLDNLPVLLPKTKKLKEDIHQAKILLSPTLSSYVLDELHRKVLPKLKSESKEDRKDSLKALSDELKRLSSILHTSFQEKVVEQFPTPIALAYRAFLSSEFNDYERVRRLLDIFESAAFFLYNIVLADYLQRLQHKSRYSEAKKKDAYKRFSMKDRMTFVSSIIEIAQQDQGRALFFPELVHSKASQIAANIQKEFRNSISHTKTASRSKQRKILSDYHPLVEKLLQELEFLTDYRLARIPYMYYQNNSLWRQVEVYRGTQANLVEEKSDQGQESENDGRCYTADRNHIIMMRNDEQVLTLHPMYQIVETEDTMFEPHICFLKQRKSGVLHGESIKGSFEIVLEGFEYLNRVSGLID